MLKLGSRRPLQVDEVGDRPARTGGVAAQFADEAAADLVI
jgi:hypothetical protein